MFGTMFGTIPPYFLDIVPIEKGQAFLPVPRVQHLIKRCKYEFLPHAMSVLRSSCLIRQPFLAVPMEFENRFLCLLRYSLCVVDELILKWYQSSSLLFSNVHWPKTILVDATTPLSQRHVPLF